MSDKIVDDVSPSVQRPIPSSTDVTPLWGVWELWAGGGAAPISVVGTSPTSSSPTKAPPTSWLDGVKSLAVMDTVEGMWGVLGCLAPPSQLHAVASGASYFLFRLNVAPLWEHEANRRGGKWVVSIPLNREGGATNNAGDAIWEKLSAALCSEWFASSVDVGPDSKKKVEIEICGSSVALRGATEMRISLWTRSAADEAVQRGIGSKFLELCRECMEKAGSTPDVLKGDGTTSAVYIQHRPNTTGNGSRVLYTL